MVRCGRPALGALGAVVAGALLAACGTAEPGVRAEPVSPAPTATPSASASGETASVRVTSEERADLHLWISNQSFLDDAVHLRVTVDGVEVADREFAVGSQHNWELFPLALAPGRHLLEAESDTGLAIGRTFTLPAQGRRHAVLEYWNDEGSAPEVTWRIQRRPLAFM